MNNRVIVVLAALVGACGGDTPGSGTPPVPSLGRQLVAGAYTLPAASERYFCYATTLSEAGQIAINKIESFQGAEVHHLAVFRTLAPEPEGFSECPVIIKTTWLPIYANGTGTHAMALPSGSGFKVSGNEQILIQMHLVNATSQPVKATTYVNLHYAPDASQVVGAGLFAWSNFNVSIPKDAKGAQLSVDCALPRDLEVFGWFPHMHKLGTKMQLEYGATEAEAKVVYQRSPWVFGEQAIDEKPMKLTKGGFSRVTCTFDNTSGHDVKFGESSDDEMCILTLFYTPYDRLDGCIVGSF